MGFNISGIVINKSFADNIEQLQERLGLQLKYETDIIFENASANYKDEGICDIYFSENGTLIFASAEHCMDRTGIEDVNMLTFVLSEFAMAFSLRYYEYGNLKRAFFELNGDKQWEEGEKLPNEENQTDGSEVILNQLGDVLGKSFWFIEPDEKAFRYKII